MRAGDEPEQPLVLSASSAYLGGVGEISALINLKAVLTIPTSVPWSTSMVPMRGMPTCSHALHLAQARKTPDKVLLTIYLPET